MILRMFNPTKKIVEVLPGADEDKTYQQFATELDILAGL